MIRSGCRFRSLPIEQRLEWGKPETLLETKRALPDGVHHVSVAAGSVIERSTSRDSIINGNSEVRNLAPAASILGEEVQLAGAHRRMSVEDHFAVEMVEQL